MARPCSKYLIWTAPDRFEEETAESLLRKLEVGTYDLDDPISQAREHPRSPLRRWIRELVYEAQAENLDRQGLERPPRERFQGAFDDAPLGMALSDLTGRITRVNSALCSLLGYEADEIVGQLVGSLSPAGGARRKEIELGNELLSGKRAAFQIEKEFIHANGSLLPVLVGISLIRGPDGSPVEVMAHVTDLREHKERERAASLLKSMSIISQLAGGIAHDFNNILTSILANVDFAREFEQEVAECLDGIEDSARSAVHLVKQLMTLQTSSFSELTSVNVDEALTRMKRRLSAGFSEAATLTFSLNAPGMTILSNPEQLAQVMERLVANAQQSLTPTSTGVIIRTAVSEDDDSRLMVRVEDNGCGMSPEVRRRAFDPFYTTKASHTHKGLGLPSVMALVEKSRGEVQVESELGRGTVITLSWPLTESSAHTALREHVQSARSLDGRRVLVIDDRPEILAIVSKMLQPLGCVFMSEDSACRARQRLAHEQDFDIILCDVTLEDGTGPDIIEFAKSRGFTGQVVFMSGFTGNALSDDLASPERPLFIAKPFTGRALRDKLLEAIARKEHL